MIPRFCLGARQIGVGQEHVEADGGLRLAIPAPICPAPTTPMLFDYDLLSSR